jgi:hypothetical protein
MRYFRPKIFLFRMKALIWGQNSNKTLQSPAMSYLTGNRPLHKKRPDIAAGSFCIFILLKVLLLLMREVDTISHLCLTIV